MQQPMTAVPSVFRRLSPVWLIVLLWLVLTIPGIFIRGAHYEEGRTAGFARGAFEDGHWVSPHLYGLRLVERPELISWFLAVVGSIIHRLDLWWVRLPAVLSILCGALLIHNFVRRYASAPAALFAATSFLVSPMMLQKVVTAEPDATVSLLLFFALVAWWDGFENRNLTFFRWLAIGCVLSAAALVKGPQPLGYFFLGLAAYLVARQKISELIQVGAMAILPLGITLAWYLAAYEPGDIKVWLEHSHIETVDNWRIYLWWVIRVGLFIVIELLPGLLLAAALAGRARLRRPSDVPEVAILLLFYACACTAVLIFFPGANGRYAMPAVFGVAVAAGLGFDAFRLTQPFLVRLSVLIAVALAIYGITVNCIVMPAYPDLFRKNALLAHRVEIIIAEHEWPLYETQTLINRNILLYLRSPVRIVSPQSMSALEPPFWAIVSPIEEQSFIVERRDVAMSNRLELPSGKRLVQVTTR